MKKISGTEVRAILEQVKADPNNIKLLAKAQELLEAHFTEKDPEGAQEFTQIAIHVVRVESGLPLDF